jgi:methionine aminotransferase
MNNNAEFPDSKLSDMGTSIFAVMSRMASEYNAINLSQGFPDFNCSEELYDLVDYYIRK